MLYLHISLLLGWWSEADQKERIFSQLTAIVLFAQCDFWWKVEMRWSAGDSSPRRRASGEPIAMIRCFVRNFVRKFWGGRSGTDIIKVIGRGNQEVQNVDGLPQGTSTPNCWTGMSFIFQHRGGPRLQQVLWTWLGGRFAFSCQTYLCCLLSAVYANAAPLQMNVKTDKSPTRDMA